MTRPPTPVARPTRSTRVARTRSLCGAVPSSNLPSSKRKALFFFFSENPKLFRACACACVLWSCDGHGRTDGLCSGLGYRAVMRCQRAQGLSQPLRWPGRTAGRIHRPSPPEAHSSVPQPTCWAVGGVLGRAGHRTNVPLLP